MIQEIVSLCSLDDLLSENSFYRQYITLKIYVSTCHRNRILNNIPDEKH